MMSKPDKFFPLYVADYLADTQLLTTEQHGAYLLLLMAYWRSGPLPDCDEALKIASKTEAKTWAKMRPILARFFAVGEGVWRHKRVDHEMAEAVAKYQSRAAASRKAHDVRYGLRDGLRDAVRDAVPDACQLTISNTIPKGIDDAARRPTKSSSSSDKADPSKAERGSIPPKGAAVAGIWGAPVQYLTSHGIAERNARSLIGKWSKGRDPQTVVDAITTAQLNAAVDPISFVTKVLNAGARNGKFQGQHGRSGASKHDAYADLKAFQRELEERERGGGDGDGEVIDL
jgi:uncharacterized protein YdaU (DUF1376 family)